MLTLLEEVVLLAVDESSGELNSARECWTEYALAAAVLFDLALAGKIDTDTEEIILADSQPAGNAILDRLLAALAEQPGLTTVQQWIEELVRRHDDLEGEALASLTACGILRHEKTRRLWVIDVERFPLVNVTAQQFVKQRLRRAVLTDEIPETRDIMLVSLAAACGLLACIVGEANVEQRRDRIQTLCHLETISRQVSAAIGNLESFRRHMATHVV